MQKYDVSLKLLLRDSGAGVLRALTGGDVVTRWLDVEMPEVRNTRVDLLGETTSGDLLHIELQSTHDASMALRMAEYCLRVYRLFDRFPRQILLYVGEAPLRMATELTGQKVSFAYEAIDIREFDCDPLLESSHIGDNVIAILTKLRDQQQVVRRILSKIADLSSPEREAALSQLLRISGLRHLEELVEREVKTMPVYNPIMENKVLGREIKRGIQIGELNVVRRQIEVRFGPIPAWAETQLGNCNAGEVEEIAVRLLNAASLEELLGRSVQ